MEEVNNEFDDEFNNPEDLEDTPPYTRADFITGFMRDGMTPEMRILSVIFKTMNYHPEGALRIVKVPRRQRSRSYAGRLFDTMWAKALVKKGNEQMKKTVKATAKATVAKATKKTVAKAVKPVAKKTVAKKAVAKKTVATKPCKCGECTCKATAKKPVAVKKATVKITVSKAPVKKAVPAKKVVATKKATAKKAKK